MADRALPTDPGPGRALPFAVRCKDCEEARETAEQRERQLNARRGGNSIFLDM